MSDKEESVDAILADYRHDVVLMTNKLLYEPTIEYVSILLDRIKAAVERERIKRDKVSFRCEDCAKFGCECDAGDIDGDEDCIACEKFVRRAPSGNNTVREALRKIGRSTFVNRPDLNLLNIRELAFDALATLPAPDRNCDRFANAHEIADKFLLDPHSIRPLDSFADVVHRFARFVLSPAPKPPSAEKSAK